jgi:hypothetical protein
MTVPDFENKELENSRLWLLVALTPWTSVSRTLISASRMWISVSRIWTGASTTSSRIDTVETEMHNGFRSVNERIDKLQEVQIPLSEQDELWQRIKRIENHLGLPDLQTA